MFGRDVETRCEPFRQAQTCSSFSERPLRLAEPGRVRGLELQRKMMHEVREGGDPS